MSIPIKFSIGGDFQAGRFMTGPHPLRPCAAEDQLRRARTRNAGRAGRRQAAVARYAPLCPACHRRHLETSAAMNAFAFASDAQGPKIYPVIGLSQRLKASV